MDYCKQRKCLKGINENLRVCNRIQLSSSNNKKNLKFSDNITAKCFPMN